MGRVFNTNGFHPPFSNTSISEWHGHQQAKSPPPRPPPFSNTSISEWHLALMPQMPARTFPPFSNTSISEWHEYHPRDGARAQDSAIQ